MYYGFAFLDMMAWITGFVWDRLPLVEDVVYEIEYRSTEMDNLLPLFSASFPADGLVIIASQLDKIRASSNTMRSTCKSNNHPHPTSESS